MILYKNHCIYVEANQKEHQVQSIFNYVSTKHDNGVAKIFICNP